MSDRSVYSLFKANLSAETETYKEVAAKLASMSVGWVFRGEDPSAEDKMNVYEVARSFVRICELSEMSDEDLIKLTRDRIARIDPSIIEKYDEVFNG